LLYHASHDHTESQHAVSQRVTCSEFGVFQHGLLAFKCTFVVLVGSGRTLSCYVMISCSTHIGGSRSATTTSLCCKLFWCTRVIEPWHVGLGGDIDPFLVSQTLFSGNCLQGRTRGCPTSSQLWAVLRNLLLRGGSVPNLPNPKPGHHSARPPRPARSRNQSRLLLVN